MWKKQRDGVIKSAVNGWTLFIHTEKLGNEYWTRIARRQWLVGASNYPSIEAAKEGLESWANTHQYMGKGRIEKV